MLYLGASIYLMRRRFNPQPDFQVTPIEKIVLPLQSRDELPPILAGLQWIWMHPTLKAQIFALLEACLLAHKKPTGRTGMDLWQILVLGVVRLGLDADWDRMEHLANYDLLLRQMLGVCPIPWGTNAPRFRRQTLRDNVALIDAALLKEINLLVAAAGREVFVPKSGATPPPLQIKVDTYVLETDVHFPTDLNLLFDAGRKCLDLVEKYQRVFGYNLPGWRKLEDWRCRFKAAERVASKTAFGGGKDKEQRVRVAVGEYLQVGRELSAKVTASLLSLCEQPVEAADWDVLAYFQQMLDKHLDLVDRRLLQRQEIPTAEKIYSLFEPHTEWLTKGKLHPPVELGHRLLVATDQDQLIQDYDGPVGVDVDQSVPVASRLIGRYGEGRIASISFDKGFTRRDDRELLELFIPQVIMPKRGRKNAEEAEAESAKKFVALRKAHSAVESAINALEHHGLNRCLDMGLEGYTRYIGYGVLAYNLHVIGRQLLAQRRAAGAALAAAA
ncbi:MAG TPA: ISNCY family transposase [Anaerolineales bacterium]|nr:ISNCY family transposase [Anaerolineales bacterium]